MKRPYPVRLHGQLAGEFSSLRAIALRATMAHNSAMDTTSIITVQGVEISVNVYDDALSGATAEFAETSALAEYAEADGPCVSPWIRLVGFAHPAAALKQIGAEVMRLAAGRRVEFEGANCKRLSVYRRLLDRAGISYEVIQRRGEDVLIVLA